MTGRWYAMAAAPFEAARQVEILPAGHRARRHRLVPGPSEMAAEPASA
jgi:hypothetical protein